MPVRLPGRRPGRRKVAAHGRSAPVTSTPQLGKIGTATLTYDLDGKTPLAVQELERALELDPYLVPALVNLSRMSC